MRLRSSGAYTATAIFVIAALVGMVYTATWGGTPHFYQSLFGPAVMWACGKEFAEPDTKNAPHLEAFLHPKYAFTHPPEVDRCPCTELPPDTPTHALSSFQHKHRYLLRAAAITWRIFGVAWSALIPLYGLLYGLSALALYGIFRLITPRRLSALAVLLLMLSPVQLNNLIRLRDYAKAPFLLGALLIMGVLIHRRYTPRQTLLLSVACGALLGIGLGFRMDAMIAVPAFCIVMLAFLNAPWRDTIWIRACALFLFIVSFLVTAPNLFENTGAGNKYHYFLMGQCELYDQRLGVASPNYQQVHRYFDVEPLALVQAHAKNLHGTYSIYAFDSPEFEVTSKDYVHALLRRFPADQWLRACIAVVRTIDELGASPHNSAPCEITNMFLLKLFKIHAWLMYVLTRYGRYAVLLTLLLLSMRSLRVGFAALFLLLYFGGYGAIQFASRHYFHLQFISLWATFFVVYSLWCNRKHLREWRKLWPLLPQHRQAALRAVLFTTVTALGLGLPLLGLRIYQTQQVHALVQQIENQPRTALALQSETQTDGNILVRGQQEAGQATLPFSGNYAAFSLEYLMAEFDTTQTPLHADILYTASVPDLAPSWTAYMPQTDTGNTCVFFPVYYALWKGEKKDWTCYSGLRLSPKTASQLKGIYRIESPEDFPLLTTFILPPTTERAPAYQRRNR